MKTIQHLTLLRFLPSLSLWLIPAVLGAREPQIEVQQILQTMQSWDGINYRSYPTGQPQLTVLRIKVPPNTALHWHHHPVTLQPKGNDSRTVADADPEKIALFGSIVLLPVNWKAGRWGLAGTLFEILSFQPGVMRTQVLVWSLAREASRTFPIFR